MAFLPKCQHLLRPPNIRFESRPTSIKINLYRLFRTCSNSGELVEASRRGSCVGWGNVSRICIGGHAAGSRNREWVAAQVDAVLDGVRVPHGWSRSLWQVLGKPGCARLGTHRSALRRECPEQGSCCQAALGDGGG